MFKGKHVRDYSVEGVVRLCGAIVTAILALTLVLGAVDIRADCFCLGKVGNINCDAGDEVSLGDIALLIDHLFISGVAVPGIEEANIDGDSAGVVDIADVLLLVEYLFVTYEPLPDCPPPKDYVMYFWGKYNEGWYFAYHPVTNVLDSFYIPGRGRLVVTADGKRGYKSEIAGYASVVPLDFIQNGDTVWAQATLPLGTPWATSPDGTLLSTAQSDGLHIIKTSDHTELYHDSTLWGRVFSANSERLYGVRRGTYEAFRLELSDTSYSLTIKEFGGYLVGDIVPSPDETKWYLLLYNYTQRAFAVYDVAADSVSFKEFFWPGGGNLAITPNGEYAFYTNAGDMLWGPGDYDLRVYDAASGSIIRINLYGIFPELENTGALVDYNCVTPDGRWLVMLCGQYPHAAITLDLAQLRIAHYRRGTQWQEGLTCQTAR